MKTALMLVMTLASLVYAGAAVLEAHANETFREEVLSQFEDLDSAPPPDKCEELLGAIEDMTEQ